MSETTIAKRSSKPKAKPLPAKSPQPAKNKPVSGEVTLREDTKRRAAYDALIRPEGCTLADATAFLKWAPSVCGSEFREVAKLVKRKLVRDEKGAYRLA